MKNLIQYIKEEITPINDPMYQTYDVIYNLCNRIMGWDSDDPEMVKLMTAIEKINPKGYEIHYFTPEEERTDNILTQDMVADAIEETPETWEQLMGTVDLKASNNDYSYKDQDGSITVNKQMMYFDLPEIQILCMFK